VSHQRLHHPYTRPMTTTTPSTPSSLLLSSSFFPVSIMDAACKMIIHYACIIINSHGR
jgi:hypothetical protein